MGKKPNWTEEERAYLRNSWGTVSAIGIAKHLNRSLNGVKNMAAKLKLGPASLSGDYITLNQLLIAVKGNNSGGNYILESWCKKRGLPFHYKRIVRDKVRVVYLDEFWEWAEKNRSFIDFSKFEPLSLGAEPDWVAEQRKKDFKAFANQRKDPWTPEEDSRLIMLLRQHKYGYAEMSEMLRRSTGAILRRCKDLGLKERPIREETRGANSQWTEDCYKILVDGIKHGDSYGAIARRIGRSEKAVRGKVYTVYFTEDADKVRAMIGDGEWGDNQPVPTVRQAVHLNGWKVEVRESLERLAGVIQRITLEAKQGDYDYFFQRKVCMKWDDLGGFCAAGGTDCDYCPEFVRVRPQYCARCGGTFYEKEETRICSACVAARNRSTRKKYAVLASRNKKR
jgi:hypothetical protein